jgi:5-methylthioribose kinase
MVTQDTTYVIDAEFAFYGPIAFDVAKMVANLLIAYFASWGLQTVEAPRTEQRSWLLQVGYHPCSPFQVVGCRYGF